jgi:DNA-binding NtrC family response regulator
LLIDYYLDSYGTQHRVARPQVSGAAMEVLMAHRWPGNIRELKNVVERLVLKASGQLIRPSDLPSDVFKPAQSAQSVPRGAGPRVDQKSVAEELARRMLQQGESFWSVVYPIFMSRDLTREDLRKIVQIGLENTNGNYRLLIQLFNMGDEDYKRFLSFLRKHDCHLPFQRFRVAPSRLAANPTLRSTAGNQG